MRDDRGDVDDAGADHDHEYNSFATFVTKLERAITTAQPVLQMAANGYFDRTTNTFTANSIDVVL
jgi:hypothetical protein